jgi:hypothetical protein
MHAMTATVLRGDALHLPLADESVDLVVTSPPYFGLRSYTDGGQHYAGQLGSEATPAEFVDALIAATAEMVRVVKPTGSIWINLGDKYATSGGHRSLGQNTQRAGRSNLHELMRAEKNTTGIRDKSLIGIPWRYALRCIDDLGLILRRDQIWSKPNGLPESVTDRTRSSHEYWFHFVRQPRYYAAVDEIRETHAGEFLSSGVRNPRHGRPGGQLPKELLGDVIGRAAERMEGSGRDPEVRGLGYPSGAHPLGKLPGSVWTIPTEPLTVPPFYGVLAGRTVEFFWTEAAGIRWMRRVARWGLGRPSLRRMSDHFAAFPTEWPRRIIAGWSPPGICTECGEGRRPVAARTPMEWRESPTMAGRRNGKSYRPASGTMLAPASTTITSYVCACTPYTDHPGTGEPYGGRPHPSGGNAGPNVNAGTRLGQLGGSEPVGPWREYHHDRWTRHLPRPP